MKTDANLPRCVTCRHWGDVSRSTDSAERLDLVLDSSDKRNYRMCGVIMKEPIEWVEESQLKGPIIVCNATNRPIFATPARFGCVLHEPQC